MKTYMRYCANYCVGNSETSVVTMIILLYVYL
jgi:hypothetical protein